MRHAGVKLCLIFYEQDRRRLRGILFHRTHAGFTSIIAAAVDIRMIDLFFSHSVNTKRKPLTDSSFARAHVRRGGGGKEKAEP